MENKKFFNKLTKDTKDMNLLEKFNYLKNHYRYWTVNSWNRLDSYANNVKIYNLGLTKEQENKAYDFMQLDEFYQELNRYIKDLSLDGNYINVGFNGRSGGYIVAHTSNKSDRSLFHYDYSDFDDIKDFAQSEYLHSDDVRYYIEDDFETLIDFDNLCDDLRQYLIWMLDNYEIVEEEVTYTKMVKALVEKEAV